jgi:hypothetical protein
MAVQNHSHHSQKAKEKKGEEAGFHNLLQGHTHNDLKLHTRTLTGSTPPNSITLGHITNYSQHLGKTKFLYDKSLHKTCLISLHSPFCFASPLLLIIYSNILYPKDKTMSGKIRDKSRPQ